MSDFKEFVDDYYRRFIEILTTFDKQPLQGILDLFLQLADNGGTLWVAGNGGSAAISDHTCCDTTKGTHVDGQPPIRSVSLASNGAMLTALANDIGYGEVYRHQLMYLLQPGDAVLLVSSSGNSPNVVNACKYAVDRGVPTIAFVGFKGGELSRMADHVVWIPIENYGIAEDTHQSLIHVMTQYIMAEREKGAQ
jgi:phosphoheptose isomerase